MTCMYDCFKANMIVFLLLTSVYAGKSESQDALLEAIYATNTALPVSKYHVTNILDGDESTYWKTPKGAGSGEGIMLRFVKPVYIDSARIQYKHHESLCGVRTCTVYGDGIIRALNTWVKDIHIGATVKSLFIKLEELHADPTEIVHKAEDDESRGAIGKKQIFYPEDIAANISELTLYGRKNMPITITQPRVVACRMSASSYLQPEIGYSPYNLIDAKKEFGWAEGAKGQGKDESVSISFEQPVTITGIKIWNGYQRSVSHFLNNTRAKEISFGIPNDTSYSFTLKDDQKPQFFSLPAPLQGTDFTLKVGEVYPGEKYEDLVLSELLFYSDSIPLLPIGSYESEKVTQAGAIDNDAFQKILDREIAVEAFSHDGIRKGIRTSSVNLIIRSNNSFVYYDESQQKERGYAGYANGLTTIAEGGWELVSQTDTSAQIRVFGKLYTTGFEANYYTGKQKTESTNIFQDYLTINRKSIRGKTYIEPIPLLW